MSDLGDVVRRTAAVIVPAERIDGVDVPVSNDALAAYLDAVAELCENARELIQPDIGADIENGENSGGLAQVWRVNVFADLRIVAAHEKRLLAALKGDRS